MKTRMSKMIPMLILFSCFIPNAIAMHYDDSDKENASWLSNRVELSVDKVAGIVDIIRQSALNALHAKAIISAVHAATVCLSQEPTRKRHSEEMSREAPTTPPPHSRGKLAIGSGCSLYGTNTPYYKKQRSLLISGATTEVAIERNIEVRAVYSWVMVKEHKELYIKADDLIDLEDYLSDEYSEEDIDNALYNAEVTMRQWLLAMPNFSIRTAYVGLSRDASDRILGHRRDLLGEKVRELAGRKTRFVDLAGEHGFNVRMRPLMHHVPENLLPLFECLAAKIFSAHIFSASTLIGNSAARERLATYWESERRIQGLAELGLSTVAEDMEKEMFLRAKVANPD